MNTKNKVIFFTKAVGLMIAIVIMDVLLRYCIEELNLFSGTNSLHHTQDFFGDIAYGIAFFIASTWWLYGITVVISYIFQQKTNPFLRSFLSIIPIFSYWTFVETEYFIKTAVIYFFVGIGLFVFQSFFKEK